MYEKRDTRNDGEKQTDHEGASFSVEDFGEHNQTLWTTQYATGLNKIERILMQNWNKILKAKNKLRRFWCVKASTTALKPSVKLTFREGTQ